MLGWVCVRIFMLCIRKYQLNLGSFIVFEAGYKQFLKMNL